MHYWGKCAEQDYQEAIGLFRKAAEVGDKDGMFYLGKAYENGHGVKMSKDEVQLNSYENSLIVSGGIQQFALMIQ